jgi:hypothetical protein
MQGQPTLNPTELGIELVGLPTPVVQSFLQLNPDGSVATPGLSSFSRDALALADAGAWRGALSVPPVVNGNLQFDSGFGSIATAYGCRAWVNFNGIGTIAIRGSGNISSVTRIVTGTYQINFATPMPDANYAAEMFWMLHPTQPAFGGISSILPSTNYNVNGFRVTTLRTDYSVNLEVEMINVCVFR